MRTTDGETVTDELMDELFTLTWSFQARRKQFRVGPAKIGWTAEGASKLGGSGGMLSREILKFSFFKMHIWRILREN